MHYTLGEFYMHMYPYAALGHKFVEGRERPTKSWLLPLDNPTESRRYSDVSYRLARRYSPCDH